MERLSNAEKVDEAWEMRPFWKVASLEKVDVANDVVANALVPEKVLLFDKSVDDAAEIV